MSTGAAETDTQAANNASASGITPTSLQIALKERLDAQYVDVEDLSGELFLVPQAVNLRC